MKNHLKILISFSTLAFIGIGIVHSAYADEYTVKENEEQYQVFQKDYEAGARPFLFNVPSAGIASPAQPAQVPPVIHRRALRAG